MDRQAAMTTPEAAPRSGSHYWLEKGLEGWHPRGVDDWQCACGAWGSHSWMGFSYHLRDRLDEALAREAEAAQPAPGLVTPEMQELIDETSEASYLVGRAEAVPDETQMIGALFMVIEDHLRQRRRFHFHHCNQDCAVPLGKALYARLRGGDRG